jgi:hypothetical protein
MPDSSKIGKKFRLSPPKLKRKVPEKTIAPDTGIDTKVKKGAKDTFKLSPPRLMPKTSRKRPFRLSPPKLEPKPEATTERDEVLSVSDGAIESDFDIDFTPEETGDVPVMGEEFVEVEVEIVGDEDILEERLLEELRLIEDVRRHVQSTYGDEPTLMHGKIAKAMAAC